MVDHIRKTSIIILTYNNLEYNKNCIESIRKYTKQGTYEIIVVDNDSKDGTREWLKTQNDLKVILNDYNAGFPEGCNIGIALASQAYDILLLNNDTVVTPRWLENLQTCLYSEEHIGAVGAVCNQNENLQGVDVVCGNQDEMMLFAEKNNVSCSSRWEEKIFLIGFCILIKREVMDKIGTLDEIYSPGYVEDNDLSLRIISEGYKLMLCHDAFVYHYLGTAFRKDLKKFYSVLYANRDKFKNKWGFETILFDEIRFDLIKIIDKADKNKEMNILEIGCGLGVTLLKIKKDFPNTKLYGVEPNEKIAKITKHVARISTQKIGVFPLEFPEEHFDYILIGNYLENIDNPEQFLIGLKKYLKKGGYIIGAIQNIMHYSVFRNILKGNWLYAQGDTLKKNNQNFFTLNDITKIFINCGYGNPFIFHWFSSPSDEEKIFIQKLCELGQEKDYLYNTYLYGVRFQK